jgi:hypothetical protein
MSIFENLKKVLKKGASFSVSDANGLGHQKNNYYFVIVIFLLKFKDKFL